MLARSRVSSEGEHVEVSGPGPIVHHCGDRTNDCGLHGPLQKSLQGVVPEKLREGSRTQSVSYIRLTSCCLDYKMKTQAREEETVKGIPGRRNDLYKACVYEVGKGIEYDTG